MALQVNEAVMALEAEVQQDPDNSDAWLTLGDPLSPPPYLHFYMIFQCIYIHMYVHIYIYMYICIYNA